jgi:hypothetical protein
MGIGLASTAPHIADPATYAGPLKHRGHQPDPIAGNSKSDAVLLHKGQTVNLKWAYGSARPAPGRCRSRATNCAISFAGARPIRASR